MWGIWSADMIKVGCCGFQKSQSVYFQTFSLIEIQQTFYQLPQLKTAIRWRESAPPGFIFTMKAWQLITHEPYQPTYQKHGIRVPESMWKQYGSFRPTTEVFTAWEKTRSIAKALDVPVIVFQCPAQFTPISVHIENLRRFFNEIERDGRLMAWEPRGEWPASLILELCKELNLIHCVDPFLKPPVYGSPAYFRLHGGADYSYQFNDGDLAQLKSFCASFSEVYCLFNNVSMWEDANRYKSILAATGDPV
jgi:uncharacterized protein YecE (DUF72 family)